MAKTPEASTLGRGRTGSPAVATKLNPPPVLLISGTTTRLPSNENTCPRAWELAHSAARIPMRRMERRGFKS